MLYLFARFEAFTAVMFQVEVLWVVTPCSIVVGYQCFRVPCYLHFQGEDGGSVDLSEDLNLRYTFTSTNTKFSACGLWTAASSWLTLCHSVNAG
jgi:hypothetical protein